MKVFEVVSVEDVCTLTVSVLVSALLSVSKNLWSMSELLTVYLVVIKVPSYMSVFRKGIVPPVFDFVTSVIVENL